MTNDCCICSGAGIAATGALVLAADCGADDGSVSIALPPGWLPAASAAPGRAPGELVGPPGAPPCAQRDATLAE